MSFRTPLLLGAAILAFAAGPSLGNGAIAIGLPADVGKDGFAVGVSSNYGSDGEADAEALKYCLQQDVPDSTRALCKVYQHFKNQCAAISMDPEPGTPGVGWKTGYTQQQADDGAMAECKRTSPPDRQQYCQIAYRACDTTH